MSMIDDINNDIVLPELQKRGLDDTPANRTVILTEVKTILMKDEENRSMEQAFYLMTINNELFRLKFQTQS